MCHVFEHVDFCAQPYLLDRLGSKYLRGIIKNPMQLAVLTGVLDLYAQKSLFEILGADYLQAIIKNADQLIEVINQVNSVYRFEFLRNAFKLEYLHQIIKQDDIKEISNLLDYRKREKFYELISLPDINTQPLNNSIIKESISNVQFFSQNKKTAFNESIQQTMLHSLLLGSGQNI